MIQIVISVILFVLCWAFARQANEIGAIVSGLIMALVVYSSTYAPQTPMITEVIKTFVILVAIVFCGRVYYVRNNNLRRRCND